MREETREAVEQQAFPLPDPTRCYDFSKETTMKIQPKACPFPQCPSTAIASEIRAEEALLAQEIKQRNDFVGRRIAARRQAFAKAYFTK